MKTPTSHSNFFSERVQYSLTIMRLLSGCNNPDLGLPINFIQTKVGMPRHILKSLLYELRDFNFINYTTIGRKGFFKVNPACCEMSVFELIKVIDGNVYLGDVNRLDNIYDCFPGFSKNLYTIENQIRTEISERLKSWKIREFLEMEISSGTYGKVGSEAYAANLYNGVTD